MANMMIVCVVILSFVASTAYSQSTLNGGCKADRLTPNSCFSFMLKGYCTYQYSAFMKKYCSSTCGYCCPDGTLSQLPFNKGCRDLVCAKVDRLPLLTNVTTNKTCFQFYSDPDFNSSYPWVKYYCETTFGWCCMDKKTMADGEGERGCPFSFAAVSGVVTQSENSPGEFSLCVTTPETAAKETSLSHPTNLHLVPDKLCYNIHSDEYCLNQTLMDTKYCDSPRASAKCAWTCENCKAKSPISCGLFGCCWNGIPATRPDHKDCPPCRDTYKHACNQFKHACLPIGQYRLREFALTNCPTTCSLCGKNTIG